VTYCARVLDPQIVYFATGPGPTGPAGPAGADGTDGVDGTGGGTNRLLSGTAAPLSGSGLDPLDGVNDPWRWWPLNSGWVGPAYAVTWHEGDEIPSFDVPAGSAALELHFSTHADFAGAIGDAANYFLVDSGGFGTFPVTNFAASPGSPSSGGTALDTVSGYVFLIQAETGYTGPTAVPDPTLDVTAMLGTGVTVDGPYEWPEGGDGADGDYWLDKTTMNLYGPKTDGVWSTPVNVNGVDFAALHEATNVWYFKPTDPTRPPLIIGGSPTVNPLDWLGLSSLAIWLDPTPGAPVINFTALDDNGTPYTAQLPMTPA